MLIALLVPIVLATLLFALVLIREAVKHGLDATVRSFDTLGIGCFAPTTA